MDGWIEEDDIFAGTGQVFNVSGEHQFFFDTVALASRVQRSVAK